jgi:CMP-N-acetylneuraminic acid synthetase
MKKALKYIKNKKIDSVTTITNVGSFHPDRMKIFKNNKIFNFNNSKTENMKPLQVLKKVYIRSGSIYLIKRSAFLKYKSFVGISCRGIIVKDKFAVNIDTYNDLELAKLY